jgi:hypothetical protein
MNVVARMGGRAPAGAVAAVLRGSTEGFLDDVEHAVDDGINTYKVGGGLRFRRLGVHRLGVHRVKSRV